MALFPGSSQLRTTFSRFFSDYLFHLSQLLDHQHFFFSVGDRRKRCAMMKGIQRKWFRPKVVCLLIQLIYLTQPHIYICNSFTYIIMLPSRRTGRTDGPVTHAHVRYDPFYRLIMNTVPSKILNTLYYVYWYRTHTVQLLQYISTATLYMSVSSAYCNLHQDLPMT